MRQRLTYLLLFLLATMAVFLVAKVVFMLCCGDGQPLAASDCVQVLLHGLSLDLSMSLYLLAIPLLLCLTCVWVCWPWQRVARLYPWLVSPVLALAFVADTSLYPFWGFKLDASCLQYLSTPTEAMASVSTAYLLWRLLLWVLATVAIALLLRLVTPRAPRRERYPVPDNHHAFASATVRRSTGSLSGKMGQTLLMLVLVALSVIGIRGGIGYSTTNIGQVYFSTRQFLNHAAVNPVFSFLASLESTVRDEPHYHFMSDQEALQLMAQVFPKLGSGGRDAPPSPATDTLLNTRRPNIVVILMESCGAMFTALEGDATMPRLNRLMQEGVNFTRCYGNSWRTDRGTLSTWSGYPAFPTYSVMKNPAKSRALPSLASTLLAQGYATRYLYGGDINFTNMRSYLQGTGFERLTWQKDFPLAVQRSADWGVRDDLTFDALRQMLQRQQRDERLARRQGTTAPPLLVGFSTLSTHEPWDVPQRELDEPIANSFRYLDRCIGRLVDSLRRTPAWDKLLLVLLPDHSISYGAYTESHPQRNRIPMLWVGGAVRRPVVVDRVCNQSDLAATLLHQMGLPADHFPFSRDILDPRSSSVAFHTYNNGFSVVDSVGRFCCYDLGAGRAVALPDDPNEAQRMRRLGEAYLQVASSHLQSIAAR